MAAVNVNTSDFLFMRGELAGLLQREAKLGKDIEFLSTELTPMMRRIVRAVDELEVREAPVPRWVPEVIDGGRQPGGRHRKPHLSVVRRHQ